MKNHALLAKGIFQFKSASLSDFFLKSSAKLWQINSAMYCITLRAF